MTTEVQIWQPAGMATYPRGFAGSVWRHHQGQYYWHIHFIEHGISTFRLGYGWATTVDLAFQTMATTMQIWLTHTPPPPIEEPPEEWQNPLSGPPIPPNGAEPPTEKDGE